MNEPRIVRQEEFTVVGMECFGKNEHGEIPALWQQFFKRIIEIPNPSEACVAYGVSDSMNESGEFSYLAGIGVKDESQVPEGMKLKKVPSGTYAMFTHKGSLENLKDTYNYIFTNWLPDSEYQSTGFNFERYDERTRDYLSPNSELDIYLLIEPKNAS